MAMRDWMHKYPGVQALLQQDATDELLGACVEAEAETPEVLASLRARHEDWRLVLTPRGTLVVLAAPERRTDAECP